MISSDFDRHAVRHNRPYEGLIGSISHNDTPADVPPMPSAAQTPAAPRAPELPRNTTHFQQLSLF